MTPPSRKSNHARNCQPPSVVSRVLAKVARSPAVHACQRADLPRVARVGTNAFYRDPLWRYGSWVSDDARRWPLAYRIFEFVSRLGFYSGHVFSVSPAVQNVAIWVPEDGHDIGIRQLGWCRPWRLLRFRFLPMARCLPVFRWTERAHIRLAPGDHAYLSVLACDPPYQGRGLTSQILAPVLAALDAAGLPAYLETLKARNVAMYEHFGFVVRDQRPFPKIGVTAYALLRPPQ